MGEGVNPGMGPDLGPGIIRSLYIYFAGQGSAVWVWMPDSLYSKQLNRTASTFLWQLTWHHSPGKVY